MKFISFANKSVRADLVEAITTCNTALTVYCAGGAQYGFFFNSAQMAEEERLRLITELENL